MTVFFSQGLFSSLRNTLGRRKSRSDLPPVGTGTSTGGRPPPAPLNSSSRSNGGEVKASAESLDYVAPSLPSSGSGQSPAKGNISGYQPVMGGGAQITSNGDSRPPFGRSSGSNQQLPPVSRQMFSSTIRICTYAIKLSINAFKVCQGVSLTCF